MSFEEELANAEKNIEERYRDLIIQGFTPLFEIIKDVAKDFMKSEISEISLDIKGLSFRNDGFFYYKDRKDIPLNLEQLAELYKKEYPFQNKNSSVSFYQGIKYALINFRNRIKIEIEDNL